MSGDCGGTAKRGVSGRGEWERARRGWLEGGGREWAARRWIESAVERGERSARRVGRGRGRDTRTREGGFPRLRYRHRRRRGGLYPGLSNTRKSATWSSIFLQIPSHPNIIPPVLSPFLSLTRALPHSHSICLSCRLSFLAWWLSSLARCASSASCTLALFSPPFHPSSLPSACIVASAQVHVARCILEGNRVALCG